MTIDTLPSNLRMAVDGQLLTLKKAVRANTRSKEQVIMIQTEWMKRLPDLSSYSGTLVMNFLNIHCPESQMLDGQLRAANLTQYAGYVSMALSRLFFHLTTHLGTQQPFVATVQALEDQELKKLGTGGKDLMIIRHLYGPRPQESES